MDFLYLFFPLALSFFPFLNIHAGRGVSNSLNHMDVLHVLQLHRCVHLGFQNTYTQIPFLVFGPQVELNQKRGNSLYCSPYSRTAPLPNLFLSALTTFKPFSPVDHQVRESAGNAIEPSSKFLPFFIVAEC